MSTTIIKSGDSDYQAIVDSTGALKVTSSGGGGGNASVSTTGTTAPGSSTLAGALDGNGNLQALTIDPAGKLLVDITGTSTITGRVSSSLEGLNAFQSSQTTVGTTAVQLTPTPLTNRSGLSLKANTTGVNIIYIGTDSSVTTSTGYPLFNGDSLSLDLTGTHTLYAVASAAAQTLCILEIG